VIDFGFTDLRRWRELNSVTEHSKVKSKETRFTFINQLKTTLNRHFIESENSFLFFCCCFLQNKTYTIYNTTYNTLLILHYLLYNTSLDCDFNTTFIQFVFRLHTYVPDKLQFETGFHLASSIFTLLYLAAM